jgi:hypothetical protein
VYHHHNIARALAEARVAELRRAATYSGSTASPRRRHCLSASALTLAAVAALAPTGAPAQPARNDAASANPHVDAVHRYHGPSARPSITFTNPLGRSRGPGAGAGLL